MDNKLIILNPTEREYHNGQMFILWFGYGFTRFGSVKLAVYAKHLEDALDECIDYIAEHAPGYLCDDEVAAEFERLKVEGVDDETAAEQSEVDTTCGGGGGNRIKSEAWGIISERPTRKERMHIIEECGGVEIIK
jgi:hypothetical protein